FQASTESSSGTSGQVLSVPGYPPFELGSLASTRTLLVNDSGLQRSVQLLEAFKTGAVPPGTTTRDLWEAQKVKDAILHPDTGKKIYRPFRMSGFVPYGTPIVVGLLLPHSRLWHTVFWQWLNQSHNAAVNYANRNASKETPVSRFLTGYVGAVSAAVSIAVGLTVVIRKANTLPPATKMLIQKVRAATSCSIRYGEKLGRFYLYRWLLIPPLVMTFLEKRSFLRQFPRLHLPVHALVSRLPLAERCRAIALFPQVSAIAPKDLEAELQATVAAGWQRAVLQQGL
uniref:SFXN5 protein n=1 Tax=Macrostomum lignano TaxID=282301 RepID=A0A1I8FK40_9PLAT